MLKRIVATVFVGAVLILGLPFRHWKVIAVLALSALNITSFFASTGREALVGFKLRQMIETDNAQRFAARALGIAEMEAMRANDLQDRLDAIELENSQDP